MTTLGEVLREYEDANLDEHGPLSGAGFSAVYRAAQGLPVSRLAPDTEAANEAAAAFCRGMLGKTARVDVNALGEQERISLRVVQSAFERRLEAAKYYWHPSPVTPYSSFVQAFRSVFRAFDVDSEEARARYLRVLEDVGAYARSVRAKLAGQTARGIVLPRRAMPPIIALHAAAAEPANSPFLPPGQKLDVLDDAVRERFLANADDVLRRVVRPALLELTEFLRGPYSDAASEAVGQSGQPGGDTYYAHAVRANTTLDVEAADIHRRGLAIVDALRESMAQVRARIGFTGSAAEFHDSLRSDRRFIPKRHEEIGARLERFAILADRAMHALFSEKAAAPFGVKRLAPDLEGGMTFGYYEPGSKNGETGYYVYNGANLPQRSLLSMASLALHELVPGHHHEINLSREDGNLPRFRAFQSIATYIAAYHEGWAEYAADLGHELGAYEDPYDLYGRHLLDSFISSRLVVDTGLNALGWSIERAAAYMRENTLLSEAEIDSELLRYSTDLPAQGLAYKMGSLTFWDVREKARANLGAAFDVRAFHDRIVRNGGMPLAMVAAEVERWSRGLMGVT